MEEGTAFSWLQEFKMCPSSQEEKAVEPKEVPRVSDSLGLNLSVTLPLSYVHSRMPRQPFSAFFLCKSIILEMFASQEQSIGCDLTTSNILSLLEIKNEIKDFLELNEND